MSALPKLNESVIEPHVLIEVPPQQNGNRDNMATGRQEPRALKDDDQREVLTTLQDLAVSSKATQALLERMANGNGKIKGLIQATCAVIAAVFLVGGLVLAIGSDRSTQQGRIQRLEEKVAEAEKTKDKLEKLEKLYMVRFGADPDEDLKKQETIRRK